MAVTKEGISKNVPGRIIKELIKQADASSQLTPIPLRTPREAKRQAQQMIKHPLVAWVNAKSVGKTQVFSLLKLDPVPNNKVITSDGKEYNDSGIYFYKDGYTTDKKGALEGHDVVSFFLSSHGMERWFERNSAVSVDDKNPVLVKKIKKDVNAIVQACAELDKDVPETHLIRTDAGQWILDSMNVDDKKKLIKGFRITTFMSHDMEIDHVRQGEAFTDEQIAELQRKVKSKEISIESENKTYSNAQFFR